MPHPQFSLKTMLWLMLVVAAFIAGAAWQKRRSDAEREQLARLLNEARLNQDAVFIQQTIERRPTRP
ncbi:MAG TPA: hypothetical protein VF306_06160 [Pirellulales bacterium]